jgi:hypothetical protein
MALSLFCLCAPNASICTITSLVLKGNFSADDPGIGATYNFGIFGTGVSEPAVVGASGPVSIDLNITLSPLSSWVAAWGTLVACLSMDASLHQVPSPPGSQVQTAGAVYYIEQNYQCTDLITGAVTNYTAQARDTQGDVSDCPDGSLYRGRVFGGGGAINGIFFKSTPLGACLSGAIGICVGNFRPLPQPNAINVDKSGMICLCASGGSGVLTYSIVEGQLPCGQTLNPSTGCIEGSPDGSCPGTDQITFKVMDTGDPGTPPVVSTVSGYLDVFGTGVTRKPAGPTDAPLDMSVPFDSTLVGNTITIPIGGVLVDAVVASVADPDHLTLTAPAGIASQAVYTYYQTTPGTAPGPPNEATVTCGFVGGGCGTGTAPNYGNGGY